MIEEQCLSCRFFVFKDRWNKETAPEELDDIGACHRYPPTLKEDESADHPYCHNHVWVVGNNWCGEFKPCANGAPTVRQRMRLLVKNDS